MASVPTMRNGPGTGLCGWVTTLEDEISNVEGLPAGDGHVGSLCVIGRGREVLLSLFHYTTKTEPT